MNEHEVLALVDDRGRQAAASLREALSYRLAAESEHAETGPVGAAPVDRPEPSRPGGGRRVWLLVAAVVAVVGLVAALLVREAGEDETDVVSDGEGAYLVPGWVPEGWGPVSVQRVRAADHPEAQRGDIVVYGDVGLGDPWTGPVVSVLRGRGTTPSDTEGAEAITVTGRPATVEADGDTVVLQMALDDGHVAVTGRGLDRGAVVTAASHLDEGRSSVETGGLPEGFGEIARGPLSATDLTRTSAVDGLAMVYGGESSMGGQLVVLQRAGDADDAELLRLAPVGVEVTEVRGLQAYAGESILQWYEPSSRLVVTVMGDDVDAEALRRFAEGLRPAGADQIDDLMRSHSSSGGVGTPAEGEVLVAEGQHGGGQAWRLVASDDGDQLGLTLAIGSDSTGVGAPRDEGWEALEVHIGGTLATGEVGVYGVVEPTATEVVVETADGTIPFSLHEVAIDGWTAQAFVGFLPADLPAGASLVARDAAGAELGREPVDDAGP